MLTLEVVGDRQLLVKMRGMSKRVHEELLKATTGLSFDLMALVKRKLSGDVLNAISGKLRDSIFQEVNDDGNSVQGRVASDGTVKYAAIHEFGGVINIPDIYPVNAQALHFFMGGEEIFAKYARAHTVVMPERSYMRSSLVDMKEQIKEELTEAVMRGME